MALWRCICAQKRSLFHQEDQLISRIFDPRDNQKNSINITPCFMTNLGGTHPVSWTLCIQVRRCKKRVESLQSLSAHTACEIKDRNYSKRNRVLRLELWEIWSIRNVTYTCTFTCRTWSNYRPQRSWGKVIFSVACVKNSVHREGVPGQVPPPAGTPPLAGTPPMVNERVVRILLECILVLDCGWINLRKCFYRPQQSCGKVMFSRACVKNFARTGGLCPSIHHRSNGWGVSV